MQVFLAVTVIDEHQHGQPVASCVVCLRISGNVVKFEIWIDFLDRNIGYGQKC
jgi:hypothetical protein